MSNLKNQLKKWRPQSLILVFMLTTLSLFQNCSDNVNFSKVGSEGENGILALSPNGLLKINNGALYTNNINVLLDIAAEHAVEMQITNEGCTTGVSALDVFEPLVASKNWLLADADGTALVYLKLKSDALQLSGCIPANITLDRKTPTISFVNVPEKLLDVKTAGFDVKATDETSGIDKLSCKAPGQSAFVDCNTHLDVYDAQEGTNSVSYYATDKAGNKSATIEHTWIVDTLAPTVEIIDPVPASLLSINTTQIYFKGDDGGGSGIAGYKCDLNGVNIANCASPALLSSLTEGANKFTVYAIDNSGHVSAPDSISFNVDTQPSGAFQILGITGGTDVKIDNYLSAATSAPAVNWSASSGAQLYKVTIFKEDKTTIVCGLAAYFTSPATKGTLTSCSLANGSKYVARAIAVRNGIETPAPDYLFTVDTSGPVIKITSVATDNTTKTAIIKFAVSDVGSGVASASCYKTKDSDIRQDNCLGLTTINYSNVLPGPHSFYIVAADNLGHSSQSSTVTFALQEIVCDPFNSATPNSNECPQGLRANLFYAPASERVIKTNISDLNYELMTKYSTVSKLIELGKKSNALVYLANLDVPIRDFTAGFSTTDNGHITDDAGVKLDEWFALEMTGVLKLAPGQAEGYYQLLIVSDDGSNLFTGAKNANGVVTYNSQPLINNDGVHATKTGCMAKGAEIYLTADTRLPVKIQYYQGPRTEIAMSLYMRKVSAANSSLSGQCGGESSADKATWYGSGSTVGRYQKILNEGFKVLTKDNFVLGLN